ncbi:MAG: uracil-DNA glycosylase family protein [Alphaproteobacteria bacterium]
MNNRQAEIATLQWYLDHGVDEAVLDAAVDRYAVKPSAAAPGNLIENAPPEAQKPVSIVASIQNDEIAPALLGASEAKAAAVKLALAANTLEELREAIANFDGLSLKKTATNLVFGDGNPKADIMIIGEAPGADEDRTGKPFMGESGHFLDKILSAMALSRTDEDSVKSVYLSNILNWRPPGNRSPAPGEIDVSLPFIEKHIQLVKPRILILCGGVAGQALLGRSESISKLRKEWHDYTPQTPELQVGIEPIPALASFHPAYLLRTPLQKKALWADMIEILKKKAELSK